MDPIADMLTTIRNNMAAGKTDAVFGYSKVKVSLLDILQAKGIVSSYKIDTEDNKKFVTCQIITGRKPYHLKRISKPGRRIYVKSKDIKHPLAGLGFTIISTPKGLLTGIQAKKIGLGGELICEVW